MRTNIRDFNTEDEARAFVEGVEYVNDSAIQVERHELEVWIFDEDGVEEDEETMSLPETRAETQKRVFGIEEKTG